MDAGQKVALAVIGIVAIGAAAMWLVITGTTGRSHDQLPASAAAPVLPVCVRAVESLEESGVARPGRVDSNTADVVVDERWAEMSFSDQQLNARCISNYAAGASDKWITRVRFINQRTGVVYGLLEVDRYSIP